jgi:hypothetical protein
MRTEIRDRYYRVYTGQDVDRVPDISLDQYRRYLDIKRQFIGK